MYSSLARGETFHPVIGPMAEAVTLHVNQQRLAERARASEEPFVIWDVGLGAAANAVAAIEALMGSGLEHARAGIELYSFDLDDAALRFAIQHAPELGYLTAHVAAAQALVKERMAQVGDLAWRFLPGDFRETMCSVPAPHAILYDPYSPQTNREMWTLEHFEKLIGRLDSQRPCLLTNYTRSTAVRVTLMLAGFFVGRGGATGEKDETTIAANAPGLIDLPLEPAWLERVRRSTNAAPLRHGRSGAEVISEEDYLRISRHPQFAS